MDIVKRKANLPAKPSELRKWILIGKVKLRAQIEAIKAITTLGEASVATQAALEDTQDLAEELLYAEAQMGAMLEAIPKSGKDQTSGRGSMVSLPAGVTHRESHNAQKLNKNEDIIAIVVAEAREKGEVPVRSHVLKKVNVHVAQSTGEREWFTPSEYIEAARKVMGSIDIDPASCEEANKTVKAKRYYTSEDNGLKKKWKGNVWLNPPYDHPIVDEFCQMLVKKVDSSETSQACIIVNNITETSAGQILLSACDAVCFPKGRVKFFNPTKKAGNSPLQGQMVLYFGQEAEMFRNTFSSFGACL